MFIDQEPLSIITIMPDIANSELSRPSVQALPELQGLETDARDLKASKSILTDIVAVQ